MLWKHYQRHCGAEAGSGYCCGQAVWQQTVRFVLAIGFVVVFVVYFSLTFIDYAREDTGSSISWPELADIPFPSLSICERFYDIGDIDRDLNVRDIVDVDEDNCTDSPYKIYTVAAKRNVSVSEMLWRYHFTLEKIFATRDFISTNSTPSCSVGNYSCDIPPGTRTMPDKSFDYAEVKVQVEAGNWTSRFLADSDMGANVLCHTLTTNLTVDFSTFTGNYISIKWSREFRRSLDYWHVYLHDPDELVLLNTFGKLPPANVVVLRAFEGDPNIDKCMQRILIGPKFLQRVGNSAANPCNGSEGYSVNQCEESSGWESRIDQLRHAYGDRFGCVVPGIVVANSSYRMPICQHLTDKDSKTGELGLFNLMNLQYVPAGFESAGERPIMTRPPICANLLDASASCLYRCDSFEYTLTPETLCEEKGSAFHMQLYFATPTVQKQTNYLLMNGLDFVSNVGGGMGLLLGVSFLEIIYILMDVMIRVLSAAHEKRRPKSKAEEAGEAVTEARVVFVRTRDAEAGD